MSVKLNVSEDNLKMRIESADGALANMQVAAPAENDDAANKQYVDDHVPEDVVTNEVLEQKLQDLVGTPGFTNVRYITTNNTLSGDHAWIKNTDDTPYEEWVDFVDPEKIPDYNPESDLVFLYMFLNPESNMSFSPVWKWKFALGFEGAKSLEVHVVSDDFPLKNVNTDKVIKAVTIPIISNQGFKRKLLSVKGILYNQLQTKAMVSSYMYVYSPGAVSTKSEENGTLRQEIELLKQEYATLKSQLELLNSSFDSMVESAIADKGYQTQEDVEGIIDGKGYVTKQTGDTYWLDSDEVDAAITAKGYQTADDVDTAISVKGYQTKAEVESAITGKGYQTSSDVTTAIETALSDGEYQTAEDVETAITGKGYVTKVQGDGYWMDSAEVDTAITAKGYVTKTTADSTYTTEAKVKTQIEKYGYQTSSQVETAITGKGYITQTNADSRYVNVSGDTMTGALSLPAPTANANAATKEYLDKATAEIKALVG